MPPRRLLDVENPNTIRNGAIMENETLHKSSIFEEKLHIAEMERQYGKEKVIEMVGEPRLTEI